MDNRLTSRRHATMTLIFALELALAAATPDCASVYVRSKVSYISRHSPHSTSRGIARQSVIHVRLAFHGDRWCNHRTAAARSACKPVSITVIDALPRG